VHIPDGILKPEVWAPLGAVAAGAVGVAARAARSHLEDRSLPLVGLLGAFVFAVQMLNFPIAAGVSDHVVGAGLLAIVFGPALAVLCMAAVVVIQALLFADGGITALGANLVDMAVLSTLVAWGVHRLLRRLSPSLATVAATLAGVLAGAAGATLWVILSQPYGAKFAGVMAVTHLVSGAVEAAVTLAVVRALTAAGFVDAGAWGGGRGA
jgi:cobalt/nickel transport system permease protein